MKSQNHMVVKMLDLKCERQVKTVLSREKALDNVDQLFSFSPTFSTEFEKRKMGEEILGIQHTNFMVKGKIQIQ